MSTNIRQLKDPVSGDVFYPQTDIAGLVSGGGPGIDAVPTAGSVKPINSGGVLAHGSAFDVSEYNKSEGVLATYETLTDALNAVPANVQRGGMSIKFILRTNTGTEEAPVYKDEYVQYRYTSNSIVSADFTNEANWELNVTKKNLSEDFLGLLSEIKDFTIKNYSILLSGKFGSSDIYKHAVIPVNEGEVYYLIGQMSTCRAAFVTTDESSSGADVPVVSGTGIMPMNSVEQYYKFIIPQGCTHLIFNASGDYGTRCYKHYDSLKEGTDEYTDNVPTAGSMNLVESGGTNKLVAEVNSIGKKELSITIFYGYTSKDKYQLKSDGTIVAHTDSKNRIVYTNTPVSKNSILVFTGTCNTPGKTFAVGISSVPITDENITSVQITILSYKTYPVGDMSETMVVPFDGYIVFYRYTNYWENVTPRIKNVPILPDNSVLDVSELNNMNYNSLSEAITAIPVTLQKGGMEIRFRQLTPATYEVVKTEGIIEQPTGTLLENAPTIDSGTYTADQLSDFDTLPTTNTETYYVAVTETVDEQEVTTYTTWNIAKATSDAYKYVQYRLISDTFNTTSSNWQGVDDEPIADSVNLVKSGGVKLALRSISNEIKSYIFEDISCNIYFKNNYVIDSTNIWIHSSVYSTGYINIPEGVTQIKIIPIAGTYLSYYFLTDLTITNDHIPYFVENYESRLQLDYELNESQLIDIPVGTKYFCWVNVGYKESKLLCYYYKNKIETNTEEIIKLNNDVSDIKGKLKFYSPIVYTLSMFKDFGVIGASRDSGYLYTAKSGGTPHNFNHLSWGANVCRLNGINFHCYAFGGANTRTWLSSTDINKTSGGYDGNYGKAKLLSDSPCNLYHIALGTNDVKLGIDYIGNITDINDDSPDETPDTFYGNYCKIVNTVKNHAPNAKIVFCMIRYSSSQTTTETREAFYTALKNIANHYSCPFIDFDDDLWYWEDMALDKQWGAHPTAPQLTGMALSYERLFSKCVEENYNYFADLKYIS